MHKQYFNHQTPKDSSKEGHCHLNLALPIDLHDSCALIQCTEFLVALLFFDAVIFQMETVVGKFPHQLAS
jgi:hypothetical protein